MSLKGTVRAMPTLLRVGFSEAVAYRAEMLIWVLSTTMPFVMLALWSSVAHEQPVLAESGRRFGEAEFTAYFLTTFVVRQLASSWAAWEMNYEVRTGALSMRLLRPLHPLVAYGAENIAALPMRIAVCLPVVALSLWAVGTSAVPRGGLRWLAFLAALLGAWLITFLANVCIGCLSLFMQSSVKVMEVWLAAYFVFSGYLIPIELFPGWLRQAVDFLPWRYQIGLPVELLSSMQEPAGALPLLGVQWAYVLGLGLLAQLLWRKGLSRFAAYGG
ncbi:MAG: ABC-2 family transporter protein [Myxococcales bacterium]|nr:ABC-2 family transporter protein [Myxococcales bacterium]